MRPRWLLAGFLILAAACSVATRIDTIGPEFSGKVTVRMRGNVLPTPLGGVGAMELNVERMDLPEQEPQFALLIEMHVDELRIRADEPLRIRLDGDTLNLPRDSTNAPWSRLDPTVREQARYPCADSVLIRLAAATDVRVAVRGAAWMEERRLSPRNLAAMREFVAEQVEPVTKPAAAADSGAASPR